MIKFDVFISYSSNDKAAADAACAAMEHAGVRCWIAPRDITPGTDWGEAIMDALDNCRAMVLIFSASANNSPQIRREIERAVNRGVPVLPVRIEDIVPTKALAYFMGPVHWLDAMTPPLDQHLRRLAEVAKAIMRPVTDHADEGDSVRGAASVAPAATSPIAAPPVAPAVSAPPVAPAAAPGPRTAEVAAAVATAAPAARAAASTGKGMVVAVIAIAVLAVLLVGGIGFWALVLNRPSPVVVAGQLAITGPEIATFNGPQGGPFSPAQVGLELKATGSGFDWALDGASPQWVAVVPAQGHLNDNGGARANVGLSASAQELAQGQYEGQIFFKNLASGSTVGRTVRLTVAARQPRAVVSPPVASASPSSSSADGLRVDGPDRVSFTGLQGGPFNPPQMALQLRALGAALKWSVEAPDWITVEPKQGELGADGSADVTTSPSDAAARLSGGRHTAQIRIKNLATGAIAIRPAEINVISSPQLPRVPKGN
jgi:hypothetical protein